MADIADSQSDLDINDSPDSNCITLEEIRLACIESGVPIVGSFEWQCGDMKANSQVDLRDSQLLTISSAEGGTAEGSIRRSGEIAHRNKLCEISSEESVNNLDMTMEEIHSQSISKDSQQSSSSHETLKHPQKKLPSRKRNLSARERNKLQRMKGENYLGFSVQTDEITKKKRTKHNQGRNARQMGPTCESVICKKSKKRHCSKFKHEVREELFRNFWTSFTWGEKKAFVQSLVDKIIPRRCTKRTGTSRKNETFLYYLKLNGVRRQVCKCMFMNTLGIRRKQLRGWLVKKECNKKQPQKQPGRKGGDMSLAEDFLNKLPKLPSHYCRKDTKKLYIDSTFRTKAHLYEVYKEHCKKNKSKPVVYSTFFNLVDKKRIAIHKPKKDQCDTCCAYFVGNITQEEYNAHIENKESAREEKCDDKENALNGVSHVITMDVQKVLLSPVLNASALYYKTKLTVHNFTVFDLATRKARCYLWDESHADLVASVFATCLIDYIDHYFKDHLPIIIFSDGCTAQNRNAILSNALAHYSFKTNKIIIQKYLEKGHTQMEVDTVHSKIEIRMRRMPIYVPDNYIDVCRKARKANGRYEVKMMKFHEFRDYSVNKAYKSIRPGNKKTDPHVTDIRQIKYKPDGTLEYKLHHREDFIPFPRRSRVDPNATFPQLYNRRIPITKRKYDDLQDLLHVLPGNCHEFYKELPYK